MYLLTHSLDSTSNVHEFSDLVDVAECFDSKMALFWVITFATNCKSCGGVKSEDNSSKVISILNGLATMMEERLQRLFTVKC
jgi:hypothetical protein